MRFKITLNMPAHSGSLVHQVVCEHPSKSLQAFVDHINSVDLVVVEEFYRDSSANRYDNKGEIAINPAWIGKIKVHTEDKPR